MTDRCPGMRRPWPLLLGATGVLGVLAWLWWSATQDCEVGFLPRRSPAQWIVYPSAPDLVFHPRAEMESVFKHSFVLEQVPREAELLVAGFHSYELWLNGVPPGAPLRRGKSWKQPDCYHVSRALRAGTNEIVVAVSNTNGPPALWLSVAAPGWSLSSDESWAVSCAGAAWRTVRLAANPKTAVAGSPLLGGDRPWASAQARWGFLLLLAALSAASWRALDWWRGWANRAGQSRREWWREILPVAGLAAAWVALFANNLNALTPRYGFDSDGHLAYISYIQQHKALPLANEGWEMFQPPLYYALSAAVLEALRLSAAQPAGVLTLRLLGLGVGIAHFALVWAALWLLFPGERARPLWGMALAACLPPLLYLSQAVTNEGFAAALVSASIYLALRRLKQERATWKLDAGLGLCLGAALLAKPTALAALPAVFGALLWRWWEKRDCSAGSFAGRLGLILGVCVMVCGWHYARLWAHFGSPLIGIWDPRLGIPWWQDDGCRTSAFYSRFGRVLIYPWFGSLQSFADGIYSTLWGDGLLAGASGFAYAPPWNCDLMAIAYWLALLPTAGMLAGGILALVKFARQPSPEWFLMIALGFMAVAAMVYLSLSLPYCCHVKVFYGMIALVPFCACGSLGLAFLAGRSRRRRFMVGLLFGVWAINSYASFWIVRSSVPAVLARSQYLFQTGRYVEAAGALTARLDREPQNAPVRQLLVNVLSAAGQSREALRQTEILLRDHPDDAQAHLAMAEMLATQRQTGEAIRHARRASVLAPGGSQAYECLAKLLESEGHYEESLAAAREGLCLSPFNPELHLVLGAALLRSGAQDEAAAQLRLALALKPNVAQAHALLGSALARQGRFDEAQRHLAEALRLQPDNVAAHCQLAVVLEEQQQTTQAVAHYREALRLQPDCREALNNLAWIRAANPQAELRNGAEAVELAERACRASDYRDPNLVSTLAAAYAEAGRFEEAVAAATRARDMALAGGQNDMAEETKKLIALFSARQSYREPAAPTPRK